VRDSNRATRNRLLLETKTPWDEGSNGQSETNAKASVTPYQRLLLTSSLLFTPTATFSTTAGMDANANANTGSCVGIGGVVSGAWNELS
jgi:hypothetical protein